MGRFLLPVFDLLAPAWRKLLRLELILSVRRNTSSRRTWRRRCRVGTSRSGRGSRGWSGAPPSTSTSTARTSSPSSPDSGSRRRRRRRRRCVGCDTAQSNGFSVLMVFRMRISLLENFETLNRAQRWNYIFQPDPDAPRSKGRKTTTTFSAVVEGKDREEVCCRYI